MAVHAWYLFALESLMFRCQQLLGEFVGDADMAVHAGPPLFCRLQVNLSGPDVLFGFIHVIETVAITALPRIRTPHRFPYRPGQVRPPLQKFLPGVDGAPEMLEQFIGRGDLADNLVAPVLRHVAIGADRAHPGPVGVMNSVLVFPVNVVPDFMARDTEGLGVGYFQGPVETSPQQDTRNEREYQCDAGRFKTRAQETTPSFKCCAFYSVKKSRLLDCHSIVSYGWL